MGFMEDWKPHYKFCIDTDISFELNEIKRSVPPSGKRATIRFSEFKRIRYWYPLMVGIGLLLQQLSGINGDLFYSSNIFYSAGISSSKAATLGLGVIQIVATAITTSVVDKSGRRALLRLSSFLMVASNLLVSLLVSKDSSLYGFYGMLSLIGLLVMATGFSLGLGPNPWVIMAEVGCM